MWDPFELFWGSMKPTDFYQNPRFSMRAITPLRCKLIGMSSPEIVQNAGGPPAQLGKMLVALQHQLCKMLVGHNDIVVPPRFDTTLQQLCCVHRWFLWMSVESSSPMRFTRSDKSTHIWAYIFSFQVTSELMWLTSESIFEIIPTLN